MGFSQSELYADLSKPPTCYCCPPQPEGQRPGAENRKQTVAVTAAHTFLYRAAVSADLHPARPQSRYQHHAHFTDRDRGHGWWRTQKWWSQSLHSHLQDSTPQGFSALRSLSRGKQTQVWHPEGMDGKETLVHGSGATASVFSHWVSFTPDAEPAKPVSSI